MYPCPREQAWTQCSLAGKKPSFLDFRYSFCRWVVIKVQNEPTRFSQPWHAVGPKERNWLLLELQAKPDSNRNFGEKIFLAKFKLFQIYTLFKLSVTHVCISASVKKIFEIFLLEYIKNDFCTDFRKTWFMIAIEKWKIKQLFIILF